MADKSAKKSSDLNGYELSRRWFDFAFENQGKVTGNHGCLYLWLVELNNRMGWAKEFASPASQTMAAVGINSYNTYKKVLNDLIDWGFVRMVKPSKNQYTANVIALSKNDKALYKALDKAVTKHCSSTVQSTDSINKQVNKETKKQRNNKGDRFSISLKNYLDMRSKIRKPATERAIEMIENKLEELSEGDENLKIKILDQSTMNSWQGIFPLKDEHGEKEKLSGQKEKRSKIEDTIAIGERVLNNQLANLK